MTEWKIRLMQFYYVGSNIFLVSWNLISVWLKMTQWKWKLIIVSNTVIFRLGYGICPQVGRSSVQLWLKHFPCEFQLFLDTFSGSVSKCFILCFVSFYIKITICLLFAANIMHILIDWFWALFYCNVHGPIAVITVDPTLQWYKLQRAHTEL